MKLTKRQLQKLIKEELERTLYEDNLQENTALINTVATIKTSVDEIERMVGDLWGKDTRA